MLLQAILSGLAVGGVYALVAMGFSITFTTTRTLNFAHGEFVSVGAFISVTVILLLSGSSSIAVMHVSGTVAQQLIGIACSLFLMALLGMVLYWLGVRPFAGKPGLSWVVSTLGFGIIIQAIGLSIWGPGAVVVTSPVGDGLVDIFGATIRRQELLTLVVAIAIALMIDLLITRTTAGKIMRAVAHDPRTASLMGINVQAVMLCAFAASAVLAALSGILIAPVATASIYLGLAYGLKGFSAALVGGLNNPRGCVLGGFTLGVLESLVNLWQAQLRDIFVFTLVILVLALRPQGLLGRKVVDKV
jgi:branched-chain amino acid transport system permease protein